MKPYVYVIHHKNPDTGEPVTVVPHLRDVVIFAKEQKLSVYEVRVRAHYPNGTSSKVDTGWLADSGYVVPTSVQGVIRYDWR
jgi:hypothetical protein